MLRLAVILLSLYIYPMAQAQGPADVYILDDDADLDWQNEGFQKDKDGNPTATKFTAKVCDKEAVYCKGWYTLMNRGQPITGGAVCRANSLGMCPSKPSDCGNNDRTVAFSKNKQGPINPVNQQNPAPSGDSSSQSAGEGGR